MHTGNGGNGKLSAIALDKILHALTRSDLAQGIGIHHIETVMRAALQSKVVVSSEKLNAVLEAIAARESSDIDDPASKKREIQERLAIYQRMLTES